MVGSIAHFGAAFYYSLFHAEVHRVAAYVNAQGPGNVAVYQMPRREHDLGTLKPTIQETSHPSLAMYLDRPLLEAETMEQLFQAPKPLWIITRMGRVTDEEIGRAHV